MYQQCVNSYTKFAYVEVCPPYANGNTFVPCAIVNGTCYCVASQNIDDGLFVNRFPVFKFISRIRIRLYKLYVFTS